MTAEPDVTIQRLAPEPLQADPKMSAGRFRGTVGLHEPSGYEKTAELPTGITAMERKLR